MWVDVKWLSGCRAFAVACGFLWFLLLWVFLWFWRFRRCLGLGVLWVGIDLLCFLVFFGAVARVSWFGLYVGGAGLPFFGFWYGVYGLADGGFGDILGLWVFLWCFGVWRYPGFCGCFAMFVGLLVGGCVVILVVFGVLVVFVVLVGGYVAALLTSV